MPGGAAAQNRQQAMENQIGKNIEWGLRALKQSQEWLAEQVGVPDRVVARWISSGQIGVDHATKVAALLKIPLKELLCIEDASRPQNTERTSSLKSHVICVDEDELHMILSLRNAPGDVRALATMNLFRFLGSANKKP